MSKSKLLEKVFFTNRNVSSKGRNSRDKKTILICVKSAKALFNHMKSYSSSASRAPVPSSFSASNSSSSPIRSLTIPALLLVLLPAAAREGLAFDGFFLPGLTLSSFCLALKATVAASLICLSYIGVQSVLGKFLKSSVKKAGML